MDKGRRNELTKLKYKKRLKNLGIDEEKLIASGSDVNLHCYKSTGKPCSCPMCAPEKYKRSEKHKKRLDLENED